MTTQLGLALSGGTARSIAHVGVLKALLEAGINPDYLAGTSGGSIVAIMLASGRSIEELEEIAHSMSWSKLASIKLSRLGFASSKRIEKTMDELLNGMTFSQLKIPCAVTATDLTTGEKKIFTEGPISRAVRASCSIPQIFLPVEIHGRYYVDGGLSEYMPVQTLRDMGATYTVGVHLAGARRMHEQPSNLLQLIMQLITLISRQNLSVSLKHADYVIAPDIDDFSAFDFGPTEELMLLGYETATQHTDRIKQSIEKKQKAWSRFCALFKRFLN